MKASSYISNRFVNDFSPEVCMNDRVSSRDTGRVLLGAVSPGIQVSFETILALAAHDAALCRQG